MRSSLASRLRRSSIRSWSAARSRRTTCPCGASRRLWCSESSTSRSCARRLSSTASGAMPDATWPTRSGAITSESTATTCSRRSTRSPTSPSVRCSSATCRSACSSSVCWASFGPEWFQVGHPELPGDSDQIVAEVNRAHTWVEYTVFSSFVHLVGLTPAHRKEAVHAIAVATRDIGLAAIDRGDPEVAELTVRFFNTYLRAALNQSAPTFASTTMNEYRRFAIGALEWRPDISVEAASHVLRYGRHFDEAGMPAIFGAAAEDVADLAIEAWSRDTEVTRRLARLLVRNLLDLIPNARPIGLNGLFKAVAKLTFWAMAAEAKDIAHILVEGIAAAPPDFVDAALDRMEVMQNGLFWEVNERVVAFDWVEEPLRAEIPRLRTALRRAKASGRGLTIELDDPRPTGPVDLVQPEPAASPQSNGAAKDAPAAKETTAAG